MIKLILSLVNSVVELWKKIGATPSRKKIDECDEEIEEIENERRKIEKDIDDVFDN